VKEIKILIAEDYIDNFLLLKAQLKGLPYNLTHCLDGKKALEKIESEQFDLYLIDIQMPVLDGYDFIRIIRENNNKTPAIAQTAHAFESDHEKCIRVGYDDYISKPIKKSVLIEKINLLVKAY